MLPLCDCHVTPSHYTCILLDDIWEERKKEKQETNKNIYHLQCAIELFRRQKPPSPHHACTVITNTQKQQQQKNKRSPRCIERISPSNSPHTLIPPTWNPGKELTSQNQGKKNSSQDSKPSIKTLAISAPPSSSSLHSTSDKTPSPLLPLSLSSHTLSLALSLSHPRTKTETNKCTISATSRDKLQTKTGGSVSSQRCRRSGSHGWVWCALVCCALLSVARVGRASKPVVQAEGNTTKAKEPPSPAPPTSCLQTYGAYLIRMYSRSSYTMDDRTISRPSSLPPSDWGMLWRVGLAVYVLKYICIRLTLYDTTGALIVRLP